MFRRELCPIMNRHLPQFKLLTLFILAFLSGCNAIQLPIEKYHQYEYTKSYTFENDTLNIELKNPLRCPLRVWIFTSNKDLQKKLNQSLPILLETLSDTILTYTDIYNFDKKLHFASRLGSTSKKIESTEFDFPFPKDKEYKILQGNNTDFTHNSDYSRYALDFNLKINDTICAATNGYVVGVIDKYQFSGKGNEWRPYANYLSIYNPNSGIFCQYAHLIKNGSLVKIGDKVEMGQPIALSGNTGQSTVAHLHFNCLKPIDNNDGLISIPIEFINGQKGLDLKKGDVVKK